MKYFYLFIILLKIYKRNFIIIYDKNEFQDYIKNITKEKTNIVKKQKISYKNEKVLKGKI